MIIKQWDDRPGFFVSGMGSPRFGYNKHVMLLCSPVAGVGKSNPREKRTRRRFKEKKRKRKSKTRSRIGTVGNGKKKERKKHQILVPYRYCGALQSRGKNTSEY